MDDPLKKLIRELRSESCPASVPDQVSQRIAREAAKKFSGVSLLASFVLGALAVVLVGTSLFWRGTDRVDDPRGETPTLSDSGKVLEQTHEVLAAVGHVLIRAGGHAEAALRKEAVPPLLRSFHTAKDKITRPL
jgi:cytochrome b561